MKKRNIFLVFIFSYFMGCHSNINSETTSNNIELNSKNDNCYEQYIPEYFTNGDLLPDGKKYVYLSYYNKQNEIFIENIDGTNKIQLTNREELENTNLILSPKGDKISYTKNGNLYIIDIDGKNKLAFRTNIYESYNYKWSPDGRKIVYIDKDTIYVINSDGTNKTAILDDNNSNSTPIWTPDGTKITFLSKKNNISQIKVIGVNGENLTTLMEDSYYISNISWSPDGNKLILQSIENKKANIYSINSNGTDKKQLTNSDNNTNPLFSPDGKNISFIVNELNEYGNIIRNDIYIMDVEGKNIKQLTDSSTFKYSLKWSSDSSQILFNSRGALSEIFLLDVNNKQIKRLSPIQSYNKSPALSPDGSKIAFISGRDGNQEIYTMKPDGTEQKRITNTSHNEEFIKWSPDGRKIAFVSDKEGFDNIYIINKDGENEKRISIKGQCNYYPTWSPDGSRIAYLNGDKDYADIIIKDLNNDTEIIITSGTDLKSKDSLEWSPDGTKMAYVGGVNDFFANFLYFLDIKNDRTTEVAQVNYHHKFSWSPDSKKIIFVRNSDGFRKKSQLGLITFGKSNFKMKNNNEVNYLPTYSPDGSKIAFLSYPIYFDFDSSTYIYTSDSDGSNLMKVNTGGCSEYDQVWSTDSKSLIFVSLRNNSKEIYSINSDGSNLMQLTGKK